MSPSQATAPTLEATLAPTTPDPVLGRALTRGVRRPLEALRAVLESFTAEFDADDPRAGAMDGALRQIGRLDRNVRDLIDWARPEDPRPLECSVSEIAYTARFHMPHRLWADLTIARERDLPNLFVDGPVLSRSIARLVEAAEARARQGVLLSVMRCGEGVSFAVTFRGRAPHDTDPTGLCHGLARRDLLAIGCGLEATTSPQGDTSYTVRVPAAMVREEAA